MEGASKFLIFSTSKIESGNGFDSIIVAQGSTIKDMHDLSGRRVAVFPGTTASRTLAYVFAKEFPGLPLPVAMPLPPTAHLAALEKGEVDAVHAYEPYLSRGLVTKGFRRVVPSLYAKQQSPNPIGVAAVNRNWYENSGDAAFRAIRALDKAAGFIAAYPDKSRMISSKFTGTDPEVAKVMNIMPMSSSDTIGVGDLREYCEKLLLMKEISFVPRVEAICIKSR